MRKNAKQIAALALALGMTAGGMGGFQAYAAGVDEAAVESLSNGKNSMSMTVEGTIKATQVKVTVPLKAAFDIDPGKCNTALESTDGLVKDGMVTQAKNYTITNGSVIPVWVYISGIAAKTHTDDNSWSDIELVNSKSAMTTPGGKNKVMIAIKDAARDTDISAQKITAVDGAQFWLSATKPTGDNYYMDADQANVTSTYGKLEATGSVTGSSSMNLHVYALTKGTWADGDKFAVAPTFTVSATDPSKVSN